MSDEVARREALAAARAWIEADTTVERNQSWVALWEPGGPLEGWWDDDALVADVFDFWCEQRAKKEAKRS